MTVSGLGREGSQTVVYVDTGRAAYLQTNTLAAHLAEFTRDLLRQTLD